MSFTEGGWACSQSQSQPEQKGNAPEFGWVYNLNSVDLPYILSLNRDNGQDNHDLLTNPRKVFGKTLGRTKAYR